MRETPPKTTGVGPNHLSDVLMQSIHLGDSVFIPYDTLITYKDRWESKPYSIDILLETKELEGGIFTHPRRNQSSFNTLNYAQ